MTSARKPPEPNGHEVIEDWIRRVMPDLQPIVRRIDRLIREEITGLQYAVKWRKAYYGLPARGWIVEVAPYDVSVNIVFFAGAAFTPPPPLGGDGRSRYVKLRSLEEVEAPVVRSWIRQAAGRSGWKR